MKDLRSFAWGMLLGQVCVTFLSGDVVAMTVGICAITLAIILCPDRQ